MVIVVMAAQSFFVEHKGIHNFLYNYQVEKIQTKGNCNTLFIGDSALGNAINSDLFSELTQRSTLNVALTGTYGYAGSYNMLKKATNYHPEIKNVIIMQTLDMPTRGVSFGGYAKTVTNLDDILELSFEEKKLVLAQLLDITDLQLARGYHYDSFIENDYVKQGPKADFKGYEVTISKEKINTNKDHFLKKIVDYCEAHEINLLYVHGPFYDKSAALSQPYISLANEKITAIGLPIAGGPVAIPNAKLGDSDDHINPLNKDEITKVYADLITSHLR